MADEECIDRALDELENNPDIQQFIIDWRCPECQGTAVQFGICEDRAFYGPITCDNLMLICQNEHVWQSADEEDESCGDCNCTCGG